MKGLVSLALFAIGLSACSSFDPYAKAKDAVKRKLNDPYSAQFEDVEACPKNKGIVTGKVNAKNLMGAYTGRETFYVVDGVATLANEFEAIESNDKRYSYSTQLVRACYDGADPDFNKYLADVKAGKAVDDESWFKRVDAEYQASLNNETHPAK